MVEAPSPAGGDWKSRSTVVAAPPAGTEEIDQDVAPDLKHGQLGSPIGRAKAKERVLGNVLTFFGNGGPTAIARGAQSAWLWPAGPSGARPGEGPLDVYQRKRDETEADLANAERKGPQVTTPEVSLRSLPLVGNMLPDWKAPSATFNPIAMAGAAAPSLIAPNPTGAAGRMLLGALLGGESAATRSKADLTKGQLMPFLKDTGKGLAFGAGASGMAEGLTLPMRAISASAPGRIGAIVQTKASKDVADVAGEVASLKGQLGGESQKMSRLFENTQRAAGGSVAPVGETAIDPVLQRKAFLALSDPGTARLQEKVIQRGLNEMPGQQGTVERLEQELAAKSAGAAEEAAGRTRDFFAKPTIKTDVLPRIGRQLQNAATGTVAAVPAAIGFGAAGGKMAGIAALAAGASHGFSKNILTSARTTLGNPRLQVGALETLIKSSQAGQKALQIGARSAATTEPELDQEKEAAIQAFLTGG